MLFRSQEIGLRKALGANKGDILIQFLIEAMVVSIAGGVVGVLIGIGAVGLVATFSPLKASISFTGIALSFSVSGGIGLFFGVVPAQRAAKLDPIAALKSV